LPATGPAPVKNRDAAPRPNRIAIEVIRSDPALVDRLAIPAGPPTWESIGTDELLRQLDRIGLAGGIVVKNGKRQVWFHAAGGG